MIFRMASFNQRLTVLTLSSSINYKLPTIPLHLFSSASAFSAFKKPNSEHLDKVTGWEDNPERRKEITDKFKAIGMRFDKGIKGWTSSQPLEYEKVLSIIQSPSSNVQVVSEIKEEGPTSYQIRIDSLLKKWEVELSNILPKNCNKQRFFQALRSALLSAGKIGNVSSDEALFTACSNCAQLGITPGPLNEGYFSSRENQIEFLVGYKGLIALARRIVPGLQIEANVVRNGDEFTYQLGTNPKIQFQPSSDANPDDILYAYVFIRFPEGTEKLNVVDLPHVQKRMACSRGAHSPSSPWKKFKREMWLKTAIKEAFRFINISPESVSKNNPEEAILAIKQAIASLQSELEDKPENIMAENDKNPLSI